MAPWKFSEFLRFSHWGWKKTKNTVPMEKSPDEIARGQGGCMAVSYTHLDVYKRQPEPTRTSPAWFRADFPAPPSTYFPSAVPVPDWSWRSADFPGEDKHSYHLCWQPDLQIPAWSAQELQIPLSGLSLIHILCSQKKSHIFFLSHPGLFLLPGRSPDRYRHRKSLLSYNSSQSSFLCCVKVYHNSFFTVFQ